jgi:hypothetical protein
MAAKIVKTVTKMALKPCGESSCSVSYSSADDHDFCFSHRKCVATATDGKGKLAGTKHKCSVCRTWNDEQWRAFNVAKKQRNRQAVYAEKSDSKSADATRSGSMNPKKSSSNSTVAESEIVLPTDLQIGSKGADADADADAKARASAKALKKSSSLQNQPSQPASSMGADADGSADADALNHQQHDANGFQHVPEATEGSADAVADEGADADAGAGADADADGYQLTMVPGNVVKSPGGHYFYELEGMLHSFTSPASSQRAYDNVQLTKPPPVTRFAVPTRDPRTPSSSMSSIPQMNASANPQLSGFGSPVQPLLVRMPASDTTDLPLRTTDDKLDRLITIMDGFNVRLRKTESRATDSTSSKRDSSRQRSPPMKRRRSRSPSRSSRSRRRSRSHSRSPSGSAKHRSASRSRSRSADKPESRSEKFRRTVKLLTETFEDKCLIGPGRQATRFDDPEEDPSVLAPHPKLTQWYKHMHEVMLKSSAYDKPGTTYEPQSFRESERLFTNCGSDAWFLESIR